MGTWSSDRVLRREGDYKVLQGMIREVNSELHGPLSGSQGQSQKKRKDVTQGGMLPGSPAAKVWEKERHWQEGRLPQLRMGESSNSTFDERSSMGNLNGRERKTRHTAFDESPFAEDHDGPSATAMDFTSGVDSSTSADGVQHGMPSSSEGKSMSMNGGFSIRYGQNSIYILTCECLCFPPSQKTCRDVQPHGGNSYGTPEDPATQPGSNYVKVTHALKCTIKTTVMKAAILGHEDEAG